LFEALHFFFRYLPERNYLIRLFFGLFTTACSLLLCLIATSSHAQIKVRGTVYDSSRTYPLESVSVLTTSGRGTATDANGHYEIEVTEKDSIWFSYLNKPTKKFPVLKMSDISQFDISLQVNIQVLKEVKIRPRDYRLDSIQNRRDYDKIFNYQKVTLGSMTSIGPNGAGIDLNELIRAFQYRKNKNMIAFRQRLLEQEHDKFIDHRFNKLLVRQLTQLSGDDVDEFMRLYRPTYEFALYTSDYEFRDYIKRSGKKYKASIQKVD
jgi:hypothetical protein